MRPARCPGRRADLVWPYGRVYGAQAHKAAARRIAHKIRGVGKNIRRPGIAAAAVAAPLGLAYRFALAYRVRAGYPRRNPPQLTPTDVGVSFESMVVDSEGVRLPAWFIPASGGPPGPAVVLVPRWGSARRSDVAAGAVLSAPPVH